MILGLNERIIGPQPGDLFLRSDDKEFILIEILTSARGVTFVATPRGGPVIRGIDDAPPMRLEGPLCFYWDTLKNGWRMSV